MFAIVCSSFFQHNRHGLYLVQQQA
ncbi:hypothetical protein DSUL_80037 [Desulfovibrionales bacterium]